MPGSHAGHPHFPDLSERDMEVLRFIGDESLMGFTFEGLRRSTGTHAETLSRILDRLEEQSVLEKTEHGYKVTEQGQGVRGAQADLSLGTEGHAAQDLAPARGEHA